MSPRKIRIRIYRVGISKFVCSGAGGPDENHPLADEKAKSEGRVPYIRVFRRVLLHKPVAKF